MKNKTSEQKNIEIAPFFNKDDKDPFKKVKWTKRKALISGPKNEVIFCQDNVEVPEHYSQMATNVVASKYFRGALNTPQREYSVKQLISRVSNTITKWGLKDNYFSSEKQANIFNNELSTLLLHQYGAFNSPVWFNVGVEEKPQCSACFILSVEDSMESLLELQVKEATLFKFGSGAGTNLSKIRSNKELLSGGGIPSGPVSFMKGYDAWAGTIKSGGKTRRAAKMQILDVDHPDIIEFVNCKRKEEEKAWALIEQGYDGGFNVPGGAYDSIFFQNSNLSVRVTDEFMKAALEDKKYCTVKRKDKSVAEELNAKDTLRNIAFNTWTCGDPGLQFDTVINSWHTCPNSGRINASNPCSEYMHVDNSACNLASLNLMKFLKEDNSFDHEALEKAVEIFIIAQDIIVHNASYPTKAIEENSHKFRQLGLGFANIGALLMCNALPYDSDKGRALAAAIMAIICGKAYEVSAILAKDLGSFAEYENNTKEMLTVIERHKNAAIKLHKEFPDLALAKRAKEIWETALSLGKQNGYRNSQTTVLAPTGTIAFLMDCDTTGIEPDIALVKYKKLVGGGVMKIVNNSVSKALKYLKYTDEDIEKIISYIDKNGTIEGTDILKQEHLDIFDCAFKANYGTRFIGHMAHIKMMAATQPFVSGAISKTVNLPENCSIQDIYDTYVEAWKIGLKAVAIYRDNSKRSQPLSTDKNDKKQVEKKIDSIARKRLPDERQAITHKFDIAGHEGYITVGLFQDGTPGEIFIVVAKEGSTLSGVMDAFATSISLALQYGVPLSALIKKFSHMRFEPSGMTNCPQVPFAKSIMDYIFRWLGSKFLTKEDQKALGINVIDSKEEDEHSPLKLGIVKDPFDSTKKELSYVSDDAPPCSSCGSSLMVRQGSCYRCLNCGAQGGCG